MSLKLIPIAFAAIRNVPSAAMVRKRAVSFTRLAECGAALVLPGWLFWRFSRELLARATIIGYDEQYFVWGGWSILKGLAPYKDFLEYKPPLTFLTHALALKLFGIQGYQFRWYFFWFSLTSVMAFLASLLKRGADAVLCAALGIGVVHLFVNPAYHELFLADTESIGLSYFFLGVAFLILPTRFRTAAEIAGGVMMTCCALSKEPFIPCVVATWASSYFVVHCNFFRGTARSYLKNTTIGVALVVAALCIYMVPTGAMMAYIQTVRGYASTFRDPHKGYCVLIGQFYPTGKPLQDLPLQWERIHYDFFNPATLGFLSPFFAASFVFLPARSWALFGTALVALLSALYGLTASHCYFSHYYVMAQSGLFFLLGAGLDAFSARLPRNSVRLWARWAVFATIFVHVWPRIDALTNAPITKPEPQEPAPGLFEFVRTHSSPTDKIFATGPPGVYVFTDRVAAVRESAIIDELIPGLPGDTDQEKLRPFYEELVKNQPKIVFLDPEHGNRKNRYYSAAILPFLTKYAYVKVNDTLYLRP